MIQKVYEKYKHLDHLLSDASWLGDDFRSIQLYEFWAAIKEAAQGIAKSSVQQTEGRLAETEQNNNGVQSRKEK
jgi:hypothetical protein